MGPTFYDPSHSIPFIERLEYIAISGYALVIISSFIPLWASMRGTHEIFRVKQRGILIAFIFITLIVSATFNQQTRY